MWLENVRDVAIVLLALESLVIGALLLATVIEIRRLIALLRDQIAPMLHSVNDTARTVKGTANVVSEAVVNPLVQASSYSYGGLQALRSLLAIRRNTRRVSRRQRVE